MDLSAHSQLSDWSTWLSTCLCCFQRPVNSPTPQQQEDHDSTTAWLWAVPWTPLADWGNACLIRYRCALLLLATCVFEINTSPSFSSVYLSFGACLADANSHKTREKPVRLSFVQCCFTSTETIRLIRDFKVCFLPRTATSTFVQLLALV